MQFHKIVISSLFIFLGSMLFSGDVDLKQFKLSTYSLKTYNKNGAILNDAYFNSKNDATAINRYYYDKTGNIEKIEFYNLVDGDPNYSLYIYEEDKLVEVRSYFKTKKLKSIVKYYYSGDIETKREFYDSRKRLKTIQKNYYNSSYKLVKSEYYSSKKDLLQIYKYFYNDSGYVRKIEVHDSKKLLKIYAKTYDSNGNLLRTYISLAGRDIETVLLHKYNEDNKLIQYVEYKKKKPE